MSHAKQVSKRKRFKKVAPVLGAAAGLSLSLASGASAGPATEMRTPSTGAGHEIIPGEEEISDVSLGTFCVFDKESTPTLRPNIQLARGGCGGGCGGGCRGGGCRGCGGFAAAAEAAAALGPAVAVQAARSAQDGRSAGGAAAGLADVAGSQAAA
jgi:hypothetical protein